jgi:hypothetical protein
MTHQDNTTARPALAGMLPRLLVPAALLLGACSSVDVDGTPALDAELSGILLDESYELIADMEICVHGRPDIPCVVSDADGAYAIALPEGEELIVTYERDGFVPTLRPVLIEGEQFSYWLMQSRPWFEQLAAATGTSLDPEKGMIGVQIFNTRAGARVALSPDAGLGPLYMNEDWAFDPTLEETSDLGMVGFSEVEPGGYAITATSGTTPCEPDEAARLSPTEARVIVLPGYLTNVPMRCN